MKKLLAIVLCMALLAGVVNTAAVFSAAETTDDGKYEYYISEGNAIITEYKKKADTSAVTVPSKIDNYPVTEIEDVCFSQCSVSSVTIPNSVVRVGDIAFEKCSKLTTVNFGSGLKDLGTNVFSETPRLSAINVSAQNPYFKSENGILYSKDGTVIYAYPVAKKDTEFTVPDSVKSVEHYAFDGALNLKSLTIGTGMTEISDLAFIGAFNVETVKILSEATYIGNNAFGNINKLTNINIPDTVTYIGKEAFQDDNALKSLLIPRSVTYIGVDAFEATASDFLIYCYADSYAVTYCETYNIEYELIDSVLSGVVITSPPTQTDYCLNNALNTSGLVVSAIYSNGISRIVNGYTLSPFDSSSVGTKAITVSYTDGGVTRSTAFTVNVGEHHYVFEHYVQGQEPTCTQSGKALYACTICGDEEVRDAAALGHLPVDDIFDEPTCTQSGLKDIICDRCGELIATDVEVPPLGHIAETYEYYVEPTCTEPGEAVGICLRCGEFFASILPALGHDYEEETIQGTCTSKGAVIEACVRCGHVAKAYFTEPKEHTYHTTVKQATCTQDGYTTYECTVCGYAYIGDIVPALEHHFNERSEKATCTKTGYTYYKCDRCGLAYYGMIILPKGHKYLSEGSIKIVNPTSVRMGYTKYTCDVCGNSFYSEIRQPTGPTSVDASCDSTVQVGKTIKITTSLTPSGIVDRVSFQSSDTSVATVSASGVITGKSVGTVKIKCYVSNGKSKTLTVKVVTPATTISNLISVAAGRLKIIWEQVNYADGYCVQYSTDKSFNKNVSTNYISGKTNTSIIYRDLCAGKKYYVRVAAYKTVSGQKELSPWSTVKSITLK